MTSGTSKKNYNNLILILILEFSLPYQNNHVLNHKVLPPPHPREVAGHCEKRYLWNQSKTEDEESCGLPQI